MKTITLVAFFIAALFVTRAGLAQCTIADSFALPVAPATHYNDTQNPFLNYNPGYGYHLGTDINGIGGGSSDRGDPVFAAANGKVILAQDLGGGWGKVIILRHVTPTGLTIDSMYAHLLTIRVGVDQVVCKGYQIGQIGDGNGRYKGADHLHFEVRVDPSLGARAGAGYVQGLVPTELPIIYRYTDPSLFISNGFFSKLFPLVPGWNVVAHPFNSAISLNIARVHNGTQSKTVAEAANAGWIYPIVYELVNGTWRMHDVTNTSFPVAAGRDYYLYSFVEGGAINLFGLMAPRDQQAQTDIQTRATKDARFVSMRPESFKKNLAWDANWELRWQDFTFSGGRLVTIWHATHRTVSSNRWVLFWDPDTNSWNGWSQP